MSGRAHLAEEFDVEGGDRIIDVQVGQPGEPITGPAVTTR
jgi:hypothetical protein